MPPALVDKLPPIWQLPSAPRLSGNSRSTAAAASCKWARMQPASTVIVKLTGSIARTRVHAAEGEDDVLPVLGRDAAADEAGVAALRHDRQPRLGADPHHRRDLLGRSRPDDEPGGAAPEPPRLDQVRFLLRGIGDPTTGPHRRLDPLQCRLDVHPPLLSPQPPSKGFPRAKGDDGIIALSDAERYLQ